jgi:beta-1,4-mannosyl-glycoprotein beta-1,4-N-acetylglucosaminyltransferase
MRYLFLLLFLSSATYAKIYDCFLFFNEWEILELRLEEFYNKVDKFVIVEANESFMGKPKPFNFELKKERYAKFADKIIYVKLEEHFESEDPWPRESWQRNQIMRGLKQASPNDLIIISDVDEFFPGNCLKDIYRETTSTPVIGFVHRMYRWFLNRTTNEWWAGAAASQYKFLSKYSPQKIREFARGAKIKMYWIGWHFTSMGGYERALDKYRNYSHGSDHLWTYEEWRREVETCPLVPIDETFPEYVRKNIPYLSEIGLID